jgi:hypothetical protein
MGPSIVGLLSTWKGFKTNKKLETEISNEKNFFLDR